jgi:Fanconi anemia group M protein
MLNIKNFIPRLYQESILATAIKNNTLVVLPTGLGKTHLSLLVAVHRLKNFPNSKILFLAPTKPLANQHLQTYKKFLDINPEKLVLFTGFIKPEQREKLWQDSTFIFSTPQCIENDLENNRINLKDFTLLVVDEAHRSVKEYSYVAVAKVYMEQAQFPRILALTASPGGTREKIKEICNNLFIEAVEIRSEQDLDVKPYVQEKKVEWININLPNEFKEISSLIKKVYLEKLKHIKNFGFNKPIGLINRRDLIGIQIAFQKRLKHHDPAAYSGISLVAQAIKLSHALELIQTQSINSTKKFFDKLKTETSKASKSIVNDKDIIKAMELIKNLNEKKVKHPKMEKLYQIAQQEIKQNPESKIIIFANFRDTVKEIVNLLKQDKELRPIQLVGQKEGVTQKIQIETIRQFERGDFNVLVGTSISEEGLDISGSSTAIFYEPIASEIRKIQRAGRVGRTEKGKIIFLITLGTMDEAYYWSSRKKENIMKQTIHSIQNKLESQNTIKDVKNNS